MFESIRVKVSPFNNIHDAVEEAMHLFARTNCSIELEFNNIFLMIDVTTNIVKLMEQYYTLVAQRYEFSKLINDEEDYIMPMMEEIDDKI